MDNELSLVYILGLVVLGFGILFAAVGLIAAIWKWVLLARYQRFNKQKVAVNMTGSQVATKMLEGLGITDVTVEQIGFWKSLFFGNSYNPRKKAIYLRKNIYNNSSLTAVAIASQKVAIAQRHHEGDKKIATRYVLMRFGYFAPFAAIPLVLIGLLLDFVIWNSIGWCSIVLTIFAFAYFLASFIVVILNLKIEKKACNTSVEFMEKTNVLNPEEIEDAKLLYKTYITDYWLEFVYDIFYILWEIFKFVSKVLSKSKK